MGNYVTLNGDTTNLHTEDDNVRIRHVYETKIGGCVLDTTDFPDSVIESGHVVIYNSTTGVYKPMPITGTPKAYGSLPNGFAYFGFVIATVPTSMPAVGVVTRGSVNPAAFKYAITSIESAIKTALPHITFVTD